MTERNRKQSFDKLMARARAVNRDRDRIDHEHNMATPLEVGPYEVIRTVREALKCGLQTGEVAPIAEALALLDELSERTSPNALSGTPRVWRWRSRNDRRV